MDNDSKNNCEKVTCVSDLLEVVKRGGKKDGRFYNRALFRGESQDHKNTKLLPKLYRTEPSPSEKKDNNNNNWAKRAENMIGLFRERAISCLPAGVPDTPLGIMMLAQHYGLPTPLLDFTRNPLVALYFAVEKHPEEDGFVFMCEPPANNIKFKSDLEVSEKFPWGVGILPTQIIKIIPPRFDRRIEAQEGVFMLYPPQENIVRYGGYCGRDPEGKKIRSPRIDRLIKICAGEDGCVFPSEGEKGDTLPVIFECIVVLKEFKKAIRKELFRLGVHEASLFPDLAGHARHIEWLRTKTEL